MVRQREELKMRTRPPGVALWLSHASPQRPLYRGHTHTSGGPGRPGIREKGEYPRVKTTITAIPGAPLPPSAASWLECRGRESSGAKPNQRHLMLVEMKTRRGRERVKWFGIFHYHDQEVTTTPSSSTTAKTVILPGFPWGGFFSSPQLYSIVILFFLYLRSFMQAGASVIFLSNGYSYACWNNPTMLTS